MKTKIILTVILMACVALTGCNGGGGSQEQSSGPPWPVNIDSILTTTYSDPQGDLEALPVSQDGPPYSGPVTFPQVDVTSVAVGVSDGYVYIRVDYAAPIPNALVHITAAGEVEEQWVRSQGLSVSLDTDNNAATGGAGEGVGGVDLFFAIGFRFQADSTQTLVYANWDFPDGDIHHNKNTLNGELGPGGPGYSFVVTRYPTSSMGSFFPSGQTVNVGSWAEAESSTASGVVKYHHFAFDRVITHGTWTIP